MADHNAMREDARLASAYLKHYAEMKNWPRLDEIAELLLALNTAQDRTEFTIKRAIGQLQGNIARLSVAAMLREALRA